MSTTDVKDAADSKRAAQEEHQQQESVLIERVKNSVSLTFTTSAIEAALEDALDETDDDEYDNLTSCIPGYQQHRDVLSSALQARIERIVMRTDTKGA
ncbi:hypothetical protein RI054_12g63330 [Pseudoscourfieldia marina]